MIITVLYLVILDCEQYGINEGIRIHILCVYHVAFCVHEELDIGSDVRGGEGKIIVCVPTYR